MQAIDFPTAATQEAAAACRSMARLVDEKMSASSQAAATATAHWRGVFADDFGIAWPDTEQSATDLAERLRRLAGELTDAIATAEAENTRRQNLRAEYDRERSRANGPR
jgi:uncharacterized protein YukE